MSLIILRELIFQLVGPPSNGRTVHYGTTIQYQI